jgi:hypothetical protein
MAAGPTQIVHDGRSFAIAALTHTLHDGSVSVYRVVDAATCAFYDIDLVDRAAVDWPAHERGLRIALEYDLPFLTRVLEIFEPDNLPGYSAVLTQHEGDHEDWTRLSGERFAEESALVIFGGVVRAVAGLHEWKIFHNDLRVENVYFSPPDRVRLTGFNRAVKHAVVPRRSLFHDEVLALAALLDALVVPERSPALLDLLDEMRRENVLERKTLQGLKDDPLLNFGIAEVPFDTAKLFESVQGMR